MKNPFTPNLMRHIEALLRGSGYDEETIEYATHAINQHEKLVAMLRKLEWCAGHDESEQFLQACPCCGQAPKRHASGCELAALLERGADMTQYVQCPWCGEDDFDLVGLMIHLEQGWCDAYDATTIEDPTEAEKEKPIDGAPG